jgi:hypothetical protein
MWYKILIPSLPYTPKKKITQVYIRTAWVNVANEWAWEDGWGQTLKELKSSDEGIQIRFHWIFLQSSFVTL